MLSTINLQLYCAQQAEEFDYWFSTIALGVRFAAVTLARIIGDFRVEGSGSATENLEHSLGEPFRFQATKRCVKAWMIFKRQPRPYWHVISSYQWQDLVWKSCSISVSQIESTAAARRASRAPSNLVQLFHLEWTLLCPLCRILFCQPEHHELIRFSRLRRL